MMSCFVPPDEPIVAGEKLRPWLDAYPVISGSISSSTRSKGRTIWRARAAGSRSNRRDTDARARVHRENSALVR